MIHPELRHIETPDIEPPALPEDPLDCEVMFQMVVGSREEEGVERFVFAVITPARLARNPEPVWGRGRLILPSFDWGAVVQAVAELLVECTDSSWAEVVSNLDRSLRWVPSDDIPDA